MKRSKPLASVGRRGRRNRAAWDATKAAVRARSGGYCEACPRVRSDGGYRRSTSVHHLWPEDRDHNVHDPDRCIDTCGPCHQLTLDQPGLAHELGILRPDGPRWWLGET